MPRKKQIDWIEYLAKVENVNDDGIDGNDDTQVDVIFDAVPLSVVQTLSQHKNSSNDRFFSEVDEHFRFFLLRASLTRKQQGMLFENDGWKLIRISPDAPANSTRSFVQALHIDISQPAGIQIDQPESQPIRFSVDISRANAPIPRIFRGTLRRLMTLNAAVHADDALEFLPQHELRRTRAVAVYDVGLAGFCAVVNGNEHPLLFFDLGWPIRSKMASRHHLHSFSPFEFDAKADSEHRAPVVLSHLDMDHWGFAYQSGKATLSTDKKTWATHAIYHPEALERPWIIRRPRYRAHSLKPSHMHFIHTLRATKLSDGTRALKIWPGKSHQYVLKNGIEIFRCSPATGTKKTPAFLRNNESLALIVSTPGWHGKVLLCGDADYPSIPAKYKVALTGVVAPHHGGAITKNSTPPPLNRKGTMVFSTYPGGYNNIPCADTENEAIPLGWEILRTDNRKQCSRLPTHKVGTCETGSVCIPLSGRSPRCGCRRVENKCLCVTWP